VIDDFEKKFIWFLMILPGFLSLALARYISQMGDMNEFQFTFYSLILTFVNLGATYLIYEFGKWVKIKFKKTVAPAEPTPRLPAIFIMLVLVISIFVGIVCGVAYENDVLIRILRSTPGTGMITKRAYQRPLTFLLALNRKGKLEEGRPESMKVGEAWVKIVLKDGKVFHGYPEFFSLSGNAAEIFLSPACKEITESRRAKVAEVEGPGVLIFEKEIEFIEFLDRPKSECHNIWGAKKKASEDQARAEGQGSDQSK
jgi:hypothetical protein